MAEIRQLRYFVAVAERGSVSAAGLDLQLSQSSLSEGCASSSANVRELA